RTRCCARGRPPRAAPRRSSGGGRSVFASLSVRAYYPRRARRNGKLARVRLRKLGASDISVSEISLGSWLTYSGGVEREAARACVEAAFEEGINFIDTANVYGRGASESFLGEVLEG